MKYNSKEVSRNIAIFHFVIIGLLATRFLLDYFFPVYLLAPVLFAFVLYELKLYWHIRDLIENFENPNLVDNIPSEIENIEEVLQDLRNKKQKHFNGIIRRSVLFGIVVVYIVIFVVKWERL